MNEEQLKPGQLCRSCDESSFTDEEAGRKGDFNEIIGQQRAVEAIEFGMDINRDGYNIFALGPSGSGRTSIIRRFVEKKSRKSRFLTTGATSTTFRTSESRAAFACLPGGARSFVRILRV